MGRTLGEGMERAGRGATGVERSDRARAVIESGPMRTAEPGRAGARAGLRSLIDEGVLHGIFRWFAEDTSSPRREKASLGTAVAGPRPEGR